MQNLLRNLGTQMRVLERSLKRMFEEQLKQLVLILFADNIPWFTLVHVTNICWNFSPIYLDSLKV